MNKNYDLFTKKIFELANSNYLKGDLKASEKLYNKVIKVHPNHTQAYNNLGAVYKDLDLYFKAKTCFQKAIAIDSNFADPQFNLGIVFKKTGEYQEAIKCFEKTIEIDPKYSIAFNHLATIAIHLGDHQKGIDYLKNSIEINSNSADTNYNLGILLKNHGEYQEAVKSFKKAIEIKPFDKRSLNDLGATFIKLGEHHKGIDCYKKIINVDKDYWIAHNNLGIIFKELGEIEKAKSCFEKVIKINPKLEKPYNNLGVLYSSMGEDDTAISYYEKAIKIDSEYFSAHSNLSAIYIKRLDLKKAINMSHKALKVFSNTFKFINHSVSLFRLKHDVQQTKHLISKDYNINGMDEFQKMGDEILSRKENKQDINNANKNIILNKDEAKALLPFYKSNYTYQTKEISGSCINPNKNWQDVEDEYFNSSNQIIYIDNFLSEEAIIELQKFCLLSKVWNKQYQGKYLGAFSDQGFISPIHLQIAIELKQKLPKLFGPHRIEKFWGFKYDATLGKGINIHADFAAHNLNFWITPDKYNNNINSGGLKVYDTPAPDNWTFKDYNNGNANIYKFLKDNNANCTNVPYKFNRAVLFNSAYFHETDEIDFKDEYEGRRINMTYLFGARPVNNRN